MQTAQPLLTCELWQMKLDKTLINRQPRSFPSNPTRPDTLLHITPFSTQFRFFLVLVLNVFLGIPKEDEKMQVKETPYYKKDLFDFRVPFKHELINHLQKQQKYAHFYIFDWIKAGDSQVYRVSFSSYKHLFFSSRSHLYMFLHVCLLLWPVSGFFKAFKREPGETVHHVPFKKKHLWSSKRHIYPSLRSHQELEIDIKHWSLSSRRV